MLTTQWGVFYTQIQGLPYIYPRIYGFSTTQTGLIYLTMWYVPPPTHTYAHRAESSTRDLMQVAAY